MFECRVERWAGLLSRWTKVRRGNFLRLRHRTGVIRALIKEVLFNAFEMKFNVVVVMVEI